MEIGKKISKINQYRYIAIFLCFLSVIICFYFALMECNPAHFARSGSIMTVVAICLASLELRQKAKEMIHWTDKQLEVEIELLGQELEERDDKVKIIESVKKEVKNEVNKFVNSVVKSIWLLETSIFVIGTLIWGFGDLLPIKELSIYFHLNQCPYAI